MKSFLPFEFYISDTAAIGFFMFGPAILFLLIGVILAVIRKKKSARVFLIGGGICLLIGAGLCGIDML